MVVRCRDLGRVKSEHVGHVQVSMSIHEYMCRSDFDSDMRYINSWLSRRFSTATTLDCRASAACGAVVVEVSPFHVALTFREAQCR